MNWNVIIIGGGPSGLMAAIASAQGGANTLLIDKGDKLGRKLGISGGGRCNVTNAKDIDELIRHIPGNGRFLYSALSAFGNKEIMAFFEELGIRLKEEDNGRMFPVSDKAKTVVDALIRKVRELGVVIRTNSPVARVLYDEGRTIGVELTTGEQVRGSSVIVAVGGKSVPNTGSTGDGYPWAVSAGHSITELFPTEVPVTSGDNFIRSRELQGLSLRDVTLSVWNPKNKKIIEHAGDMIFTHFGISGPIALRCSQFVVKALKQFNVAEVRLTLDLFPDRSVDEVYSSSLDLARGEPRKAIKNVLKGYIPERMLPLIFKLSGLQEETTFSGIPKLPWMEMAKLLKQFPIMANGTLSIEEAFITGGGVNLKEIDPRTMQSKVSEGLYFCGEVMDIHAYTGGYNITAAFSTGHTAGTHAAAQAIAKQEDSIV